MKITMDRVISIMLENNYVLVETIDNNNHLQFFIKDNYVSRVLLLSSMGKMCIELKKHRKGTLTNWLSSEDTFKFYDLENFEKEIENLN